MNRFLAVLGLLLLSTPAGAADLSKVDRTIAREPQYQHAPKYVLAVFGKDALSKVWLVFDGETLYVDTDSSGDLTVPAKRFIHPTTRPVNESQTVATYGPIPVVERDSKTRHELTVQITRPDGALRLEVRGPRVQNTGGMNDGTLAAAPSPAAAPVVHFGGPLVVLTGHRHWPDTALVAATRLERKQELSLQVKLGTPGLGRGTTACVNPATTCFLAHSGEKLGPDGPLVEATFFRGDGNGVPFQEKQKLALTCCCGIYTAAVPVPKDVAYDRARLTFSFPGSSAGLVEAKTYEVELVAVKGTP